jgi:regulator of RNase E activity RraA
MRTGNVNVLILRGGVMEHPGDVLCEDGDDMIVLRGDQAIERHFCLWQFSAVPTATANVRFRGKADMARALRNVCL